jgi:hypothetical protein
MTGRRPRLPNTQTPEDRALWQSIRAQLAAQRRGKRKQYGLSSNREAELYIPRYFQPIAKKPRRSQHQAKIIPFPHIIQHDDPR